MLDAAPTLRFIGEMEGDRFASRIDLNAAWARGIRTVDTTNASSYPVSEWALTMILVCLRPGSVFVSVSRGKVTDSAALIERLKQGDIVAGLDVFDPEPVPLTAKSCSSPTFLSAPISPPTEARQGNWASFH